MSFFGELKQGDISGALRKLAFWVEEGNAELISIFPAIGTFEAQFKTDLGKAIVKEITVIAPTVIADPSTFVASATEVAKKVLADGIAAGEQDALQVALNAMRVAVSQ